LNLLPTKLCQIEIPVLNPERSVQFFERVFGWKQAPAEMHEYIVLQVPDDCPFGISLIPTKKESLGHSTVLYFEAENPVAIVKAATSNGGRLRFGPKNLGIYGEIYQIEDPDGNRFGLYSKRKQNEASEATA